jgi:hypothetical protein
VSTRCRAERRLEMTRIALAIPLLAACSSSSPPYVPATLEQRCSESCAYFPPGNPCAGMSPPANCAAQCLAEVMPFAPNDDCTNCVIVNSGWEGTTCKCDSALGVQTICNACSYSAAGSACGSRTNCDSLPASACMGFVAARPTGLICAQACGFLDAGMSADASQE